MLARPPRPLCPEATTPFAKSIWIQTGMFVALNAAHAFIFTSAYTLSCRWTERVHRQLDMSDTSVCHTLELSAASCACEIAKSRSTAANSTARSFWNLLRSWLMRSTIVSYVCLVLSTLCCASFSSRSASATFSSCATVSTC